MTLNTTQNPPAIGELWDAEGGIYAGVRTYENGDTYHLVVAVEDSATIHEWGEYKQDTPAKSTTDGMQNTKELAEIESIFPAAEAAKKYTTGDFSDYFLPSIGELNHAWQYVPEIFEKKSYWSSTQRSPTAAFYMGFTDGTQDGTVKLNELRARPFRKFRATEDTSNNPPNIGEYWQGEGGLNAGFIPAHLDIPAHYLIISAEDVGSFKWGRSDQSLSPNKNTDGLSNTNQLLSFGDHPAAKAAATYSADNHKDFYLPAIAELYHCWIYCHKKLERNTYYWSSSQYASQLPFSLDFRDAYQAEGDPNSEWHVRAVRRKLA